MRWPTQIFKSIDSLIAAINFSQNKSSSKSLQKNEWPKCGLCRSNLSQNLIQDLTCNKILGIFCNPLEFLGHLTVFIADI